MGLYNTATYAASSRTILVSHKQHQKQTKIQHTLANTYKNTPIHAATKPGPLSKILNKTEVNYITYKHKYPECIFIPLIHSMECIATTNAIYLFKLCKQIVELCLESCVNSTILFGQQTMYQTMHRRGQYHLYHVAITLSMDG